MAHWQIKEFGELTGVSVRTLHHYDQIDLLKPSIRQPNDYRLYSETDLLKQQQVIALKFFGFKLSEIKELLTGEMKLIDHLTMQSQLLEKKAKSLLEASATLNKVISGCSQDKAINWKTIIQLIEIYHVTQQLEKTWVGKALSPEELQKYAHFSKDVKKRFTPSQQAKLGQEWLSLLKQISDNLNQAPSSAAGIAIGKKCTQLAHRVYGKKHGDLKQVVWEKGFLSGHILEEDNTLSPEIIQWLDQALSAYWLERLCGILNYIGSKPDQTVLALWHDALAEMCGDNQSLRQDTVNNLLQAGLLPKISQKWLQKLSQ